MASTSAPLGGRATSGSGLFTRQSSGLVRELGIPAATGISLASVAVVNTFINFNAGLTAFNQADMTLPLLLGAGIWLVAMFAYYGSDPNLPKISKLDDFHAKQVTRILDRAGTPIGELGLEKRTVVPYTSIPKLLVHAVVAAEDADYFNLR